MINANLGEQVETAIAVFGTTTRVGILKFLLEEGPSQMGSIAKGVGLTRATVVKAILALEELGAITADIPIERRAGKRVLYRAHGELIESLLAALNSALPTK